jgi:hypothetical protein
MAHNSKGEQGIRVTKENCGDGGMKALAQSCAKEYNRRRANTPEAQKKTDERMKKFLRGMKKGKGS